jgi:hypothetical protein
MRRITQQTIRITFKSKPGRLDCLSLWRTDALLERLTGAMVRVFEVRGACFPDASSDPRNRRSNQIQNRAEHKNFEGAVPLAQSGKKQT